MVSLQIIKQSNAQGLPRGLVALFIGATSGIGESTLRNLAEHSFSTIYSVARPAAVASHEELLGSLRQSNPTGSYNLITADTSLISEIDKVVKIVKGKETKLDLLIMSAGFMAFEGRVDTSEGLDPSMSTRYYSRLRAVQQLLPLLNNSPNPRIVSVLAGGMEGPLNEEDLDLKDSENWSYWNSSVHSTTMGTLALEKFAQENERLSIVHWYPGPVLTPGLMKAKKYGMSPPNPMDQDEAGKRVVFMATNDRYSVLDGGLVPVPDGLEVAKKSAGGIFLVNPQGESTDNEGVLTGLRERGVIEVVWGFTQKVFYACTASSSRDEL